MGGSYRGGSAGAGVLGAGLTGCVRSAVRCLAWGPNGLFSGQPISVA